MKAWDWPEAPRLLEDIYNFEDVLQVGCILNTFIRRSDVVQHRLHRAARQRHRADHDRARRRRLAADDLLALHARLEARPRHRAAARGRRADLRRGRGRQGALARHRGRARRGRRHADLLRRQPAWIRDDGGRRRPRAVSAPRSVEHTIIRHDDLEARNTKDAPDNVSPSKGNGAALDGKGLALKLPPHSYSMVRVTL